MYTLLDRSAHLSGTIQNGRKTNKFPKFALQASQGFSIILLCGGMVHRSPV